MHLLEVKNLKVSFDSLSGKLTAVDDISFYMDQGEILGIVGESGSGKSVTSLSVIGLLEQESGGKCEGEIILKGHDLTKLTEKEMCKVRGGKISMIFQEPMTSLNPVMTIYKQIDEVLKIHCGKEKSNNINKILKLLEGLNIPNPKEIVYKYPFELSGGMRQRIMIAIAIAADPDIIIADEPTTALDVTTQAEILDLMKRITYDNERSIMLITHDLGIIAELAHRVIVMYRGKIMEECMVLEFFDAPRHPYSKGFIQAMPDNFDRRFSSIQGNVPSIYETIQGCAYSDRCPDCMERCRREVPPMALITPNHRVACWKQIVSGGEKNG